MKSIKLLFVLAGISIVCTGVAFAGETCCDKAKAAGKECKHKCCVEAKAAGKTCDKCCGNKEGCKKDDKK